MHNLEPQDLVALTVEASAMTGLPLAGSDFSFHPESLAQAIAQAMKSDS